jgi:hypothetical protein
MTKWQTVASTWSGGIAKLRFILLSNAVLQLCGREDSNLQLVSEPDPKFDGRLSSPSAYVRLLLVCAGQSGSVTRVRPVRNAFVLACAAGFVRSFVRSQSGHRMLSIQLHDIIRLK